MLSEEEDAGQLLQDHLRDHGFCADCVLVPDDPPDIKCTVNGECWAVEVTRLNEQEILGNCQQACNERTIPLLQLAKEIKNETSDQCQFKYVMSLEGPPQNSVWGKWRRKTKKIVIEFIVSGQSDELAFDGGSIKAKPEGSKLVSIFLPHPDAVLPNGCMTADIASSIEASLQCAIHGKYQKMKDVTGFDRAGLILLNTHFFVMILSRWNY